MSTPENIDPTCILPASINHELLTYPTLPHLPPLASTVEDWLAVSTSPLPFAISRNLESTPANISRKRTPLAQCLSQSPARPGRTSQVQGIFGSVHQQADRLQRVATPMRLDTSERRVGRGAARYEHGEDLKSRRADLATFTPSSARCICGKIIPKVSETALETKPRMEASPRNNRLTSQPSPMPKRAKNESEVQTTQDKIQLKDQANAASKTPSISRTASIASSPKEPRTTSNDSTSDDEQDPRLERAIAASLSSTPSRSERRRELSLNAHLQPNLAPKLPLAFRSVSSEEWTDDDLFFPAKASSSGTRDARFDASPSTPRKPRTPARSVLRSTGNEVSSSYLPTTPKQRASRFQSPKAAGARYF